MAGLFYFTQVLSLLAHFRFTSNIAVDVNCIFNCLKKNLCCFISDCKNPIFTGQTQILYKIEKIT